MNVVHPPKLIPDWERCSSSGITRTKNVKRVWWPRTLDTAIPSNSLMLNSQERWWRSLLVASVLIKPFFVTVSLWCLPPRLISLIYVRIFLILKIVGCLINSLLPTQHEICVYEAHFSRRVKPFHALKSGPTANDINFLRKSYLYHLSRNVFLDLPLPVVKNPANFYFVFVLASFFQSLQPFSLGQHQQIK